MYTPATIAFTRQRFRSGDKETMKALLLTGVIGMLIGIPCAIARSPFDGTWRPDPQRPDPGRPDDVLQLSNGEYACRSCKPPYRVEADGIGHPISANPRFDSLSVRVVDNRRIARIATRNNAKVVESTAEVSPDGQTLTERQTLFDAAPHPVDFTSHSHRVAPGPPGSHQISGSWHLIEADLTNHDEDTDFLVSGGFLTMSDRMGRSFKAKLDGTEAPYQGDPQFSSVSVKQVDARTIEETDMKAGKPVKIARWSVDADGKTMHVQFDDTHGHVQHQSGHRIK
jgi:hypothetical protein